MLEKKNMRKSNVLLTINLDNLKIKYLIYDYLNM